MADKESLTIGQALEVHKKFLQDILQEIVKVLAVGEAGTDRVIKGLSTYWNASLRYSATRRKVQAAVAGTPHEKDAELMGRPFLMMIRAELQASKVQNLDAVSQEIYDEAHAIALSEATTGKRAAARRKKLVARIKAANSLQAAA